MAKSRCAHKSVVEFFFIPRHAHKTASASSTEVMRSKNSARATSHDDIVDVLPTDDSAEEELGSYDDNIDVALTQRKGKGKARIRIVSKDESEDGPKSDYGLLELLSPLESRLVVHTSSLRVSSEI